MSDSNDLERFSCDGCTARWSGQSRRSGLEYMFYHALGSDHSTGYEEEIEEELDID